MLFNAPVSVSHVIAEGGGESTAAAALRSWNCPCKLFQMCRGDGLFKLAPGSFCPRRLQAVYKVVIVGYACRAFHLFFAGWRCPQQASFALSCQAMWLGLRGFVCASLSWLWCQMAHW